MNSEMKDTYHNHVEDKSENISMLISELSNIRYENISLKIVDNAVDKICDVLVGNALDLFGKKQISTNVSKKKKREKKLLLRKHGLYHLHPWLAKMDLYMIVKLLEVTLEEQKGCVKIWKRYFSRKII